MLDGQFTITIYGTDTYTEADTNSEIDKYDVADFNNEVTFDYTTDTITTMGTNELSNGDVVNFTTTGTLPSGLGTGDYYVVNSTATDFQVSLTLGGAAVDFTDNGTGTHTVHSNSGTTSQTLETYTIYPFYKRNTEIKYSGGGYKSMKTNTYNSYDIHFARFVNDLGDVSDMTIIDNLYTIFAKKYIYIEFSDYWRNLQTSGKITQIVIEKDEINYELSGQVDLRIEATKVIKL